MPFQRVDITYFSKDNGLENRDIIQCRPMFHNRKRFDNVLVQTPGKARPARLHLVFEVTAYGARWQMARVTYYTALPVSLTDQVIGMRRYREERFGEFIFLGAIIRSCYLTPIFDHEYSCTGDSYLNPLASGCSDLYLRCMPLVQAEPEQGRLNR